MKHVIVAPALSIAQWAYRHNRDFESVNRENVRFLTDPCEIDRIKGYRATVHIVTSPRPFALTRSQEDNWTRLVSEVRVLAKHCPRRITLKEVRLP